ncbi:MAG: class I SAM-dependent methyltransferase [Planctomycetota bacterium]
MSFSIAISPHAWDRPNAGACKFTISVDKSEQFSRVIDPTNKPADRIWHGHGFFTNRVPGADTRCIRLETAGVGSIDCRWALWAEPVAVILDAGQIPEARDAGHLDPELENAVIAREVVKLHSLPNKKLNLGCGNFLLSGWTNIDRGDNQGSTPEKEEDFVKLDVFRALSELPDKSVDYITSEQFFEHFTRQEGVALMRECYRVLHQDGVLRIQVPDLEAVVLLYLNKIPEADWNTVQLPHRLAHIQGSNDPYGKLLPSEQYTRAMMINNGFHMDGHKFLYDFETIKQSLELAGFSYITRTRFNESKHEPLSRIDRHDGGPTGRSWVPKVALTVEATK